MMPRLSLYCVDVRLSTRVLAKARALQGRERWDVLPYMKQNCKLLTANEVFISTVVF